ncbi:MAG: hypothetical protein ACRBF0_07750 [Calditrichia bacterium]
MQFRAMIFVFPILCLLSSESSAQIIDDVVAEYSYMRISEVKVGGATRTPQFYRHNTTLLFGKGRSLFGLNYQYCTKDEETAAGVVEDGLMLLVGYDWVFSSKMRLDIKGRMGVYGDTEPAQPLYATDTDIQANLVFFSQEGLGYVQSNSFYPSGYVGFILNKFGRFQGIGGIGTWWNSIGLYLTGFYALNGIVDPLSPAGDADKTFAFIKNSGVDMSMSYTFRGFELMLRRNFPIANGGNDTVLNVTYYFDFDRE